MPVSVINNRLRRRSEFTEYDTGATAEDFFQARFQRSPYLPLRQITCCFRDGVLSLRGRVPTYYLKQLAQTIGSSLEGVRQVSNELHVDFPERF